MGAMKNLLIGRYELLEQEFVDKHDRQPTSEESTALWKQAEEELVDALDERAKAEREAQG